MYMDFTTRPSMVKAFARRSEGELLANRCMTTWAGQARFLSEPHASRVTNCVSGDNSVAFYVPLLEYAQISRVRTLQRLGHEAFLRERQVNPGIQ
jgi:hypothetical protein